MIEFYRSLETGDIVAVNRAQIDQFQHSPAFWSAVQHGKPVVICGTVSQELIQDTLYAISAADALAHNGRVYARAVLVWAGYPIRHTV